MSDLSTMIAQSEQSKGAKKKVVSIVLAATLALGCLGAGLAFLTDSATLEQNVALSGWNKVDEDTVPDDIFEINYANELDDITDAKPGESFDSVLSVRNENHSVDSSYIQVEFSVPYYVDSAKDLAFYPVNYNWNDTDWDIQGLDALENVEDGINMIPVVAQFKTAVAAGDTTANLFDGVTIDKDITREILIDLARATAGDTAAMGLTFDATGIQETGFDTVSDAFNA